MPEKIQDDLQIGIQATRTAADARPFGFCVLWIPWDSGFRGTDLGVDDVIIALGDKTFDPGKKDFEFGGYPEQQFWAKAGAKDGDPINVTVVRGQETRTIQGKVRADRIYTTADGTRAIGALGPEAMARDGFETAWTWAPLTKPSRGERKGRRCSKRSSGLATAARPSSNASPPSST